MIELSDSNICPETSNNDALIYERNFEVYLTLESTILQKRDFIIQ